MNYTYRDLIKEPLQKQELTELARKGKMNLKDLVNTKSQTFKKLQPDLGAMDEAQVVALITSDPRILRRPIVTGAKELLLGFTEAVYEERLR